ncbi:hypothetical protein D9M71_665780 [compost metagenome]
MAHAHQARGEHPLEAVEGDVGAGDAEEAAVDEDRHGEGEDVHVLPVEVDVRPGDHRVAALLRAGEPGHVAVVVVALAAPVEVQAQRHHAAALAQVAPFQVHVAVLQGAGLQHHAAALHARAGLGEVVFDERAQRGEIGAGHRPSAIGETGVDADHFVRQGGDLLEDVTD